MKLKGSVGAFWHEDSGESIVLEIDVDSKRERLLIRSIDEDKKHTWLKDIKQGNRIEISIE